jgi:hypothetical protein
MTKKENLSFRLVRNPSSRPHIREVKLTGKEVKTMLKRIIVLSFSVVFLAVGMLAYAGDFSPGAMKQIEELKLLSRDK